MAAHSKLTYDVAHKIDVLRTQRGLHYPWKRSTDMWASLQAENRLKSSSVVRVDVMNQALHTAALEVIACFFFSGGCHEPGSAHGSARGDCLLRIVYGPSHMLHTTDDRCCTVVVHIVYMYIFVTFGTTYDCILYILYIYVYILYYIPLMTHSISHYIFCTRRRSR